MSHSNFCSGYEEYEASEYAFAACHLPRTRASSHSRLTGSGTATPTGRQATKWWADGEEPIYYVVSPKVITLLYCTHPNVCDSRLHCSDIVCKSLCILARRPVACCLLPRIARRSQVQDATGGLHGKSRSCHVVCCFRCTLQVYLVAMPQSSAQGLHRGRHRLFTASVVCAACCMAPEPILGYGVSPRY